MTRRTHSAALSNTWLQKSWCVVDMAVRSIGGHLALSRSTCLLVDLLSQPITAKRPSTKSSKAAFNSLHIFHLKPEILSSGFWRETVNPVLERDQTTPVKSKLIPILPQSTGTDVSDKNSSLLTYQNSKLKMTPAFSTQSSQKCLQLIRHVRIRWWWVWIHSKDSPMLLHRFSMKSRRTCQQFPQSDQDHPEDITIFSRGKYFVVFVFSLGWVEKERKLV